MYRPPSQPSLPPLAIWSERLATGIESIDRQHQQLFTAVNQLHESFLQGNAREQVATSLAFLLEFIEDHFQAEEDHMQRLGYPGYASHAQDHARLAERVRSLKVELDAGQSVIEEVAVLFSNWLNHHIFEVDMDYVSFMKAKGVK